MSDVVISQCSLGEINSLVGLLDEEFIFSRGRSISLINRMPGLFDAENLSNIYLAKVDNAIRSSVCVRRFNWITTDAVLQGAMIGLVYTHPETRGRGLASLLMRTVQTELEKSGVDFGVLWTGIPKFYRKLGWEESDLGLYGELNPAPKFETEELIAARSISEEDRDGIELLRRRWFPNRVGRMYRTYLSIPLPAEKLDLFYRDSPNKDERFYAIIGHTGETGYIYEAVGKPSNFPCLWHSICNAYSRLYINDFNGSLFENWLCQNANVQWKPQNQAMWLPFKGKIAPKWHITYLDRI
jgi:predicted N-acetyltransferase YhbS